ncbi:MAG: hypothetical protein A2666_05435 [Parcubacteria group bacterium RIFCSPHIGHO2_01_FULL_47_10b]|nr:MAG: hypothetical protein A2666_05435 [Parcubacteria group bacterium RIFCSPHIGHO2_01_FULL_47_10b]
MPTYLHIDLNCFFASVEQQANPFLRGKPIGIVADPTGRYVRRGVLATASYPAKAKGVKSGMPAFQAKQLCPEIILIGGDGDKYEYISNCFNNIVRRYSDDVTQFSIDEAYMEVDSVRHLLGSPTTIAHNIKQAMREELGTCITCSIGIGPNRILAKLASDLQKPDGLVEITHENKFEVLRSVPLDALAGIGPKTRAHLEALGIVDFDDLYKADDLFLKNAFGVWGINLKRVAQGHESGFFRYTHNQQKSIGHSRTVNANMETLEQLKPLLKRLSSKVGQRARKHGLVGQTVHVQLKYWDFEHWGMQRKLGFGINDDSAIYKEALGLLVTHRQPTKPVRLVGVSISDTREDVQGDLFDYTKQSHDRMDALDRMRARYGKRTFI